jgi:transposase
MKTFAPLVEFNQLKVDVRRNNNFLLVGIDIAKRSHICSFELTSGQILRKKFSFSNDIEGFQALIDKITSYRQQYQVEKVICGLEATATYWKPLALHLVSEALRVVLVSTLAVKQNRQTLDVSKDKNDVKDAHNICDLMAQGKFQYLNLRKGTVAELSRLFRIRFGLTKQKAKIRIKLRQVLGEIFPELETSVSNILGATVLAIVEQAPFPKDILELGLEKLTQLVKQASRQRLGKNKALTIYALAQQSVGSDIEGESVRFELQLLLKNLEALLTDLKNTEKKILKIISDDPHYILLLSVKGIGPVIAAGLIGEIGDINWYSSAKQLTKLAGLDLWSNDSGASVHSGKHISKKGRKYLRTIAYEAAINCVRCNPQFKAKYQQLLDNQARRKKIKAIAYVAIADKILRMVFRMLKDGKAYNPDYDERLKERYRCKNNKGQQKNQ